MEKKKFQIKSFKKPQDKTTMRMRHSWVIRNMVKGEYVLLLGADW